MTKPTQIPTSPMADPTAQLSFAHLPFELRDQIWRSAAEDELPGVHNLTLYNLASENVLQHTSHGAVTFESSGAKDQNTEGQDTDSQTTTASYAMKPWAVIDGKPDYQGLAGIFQGLASVCPEALKVARKVNEKVIQGVYKANDGQTRKISIRTGQDLIYLNLFGAADIDWAQVHRNVPLFQQGVEHVAFQFDPAWCRYALASPYDDNQGFVDFVTRQPCHGRDANILRCIARSFAVDCIEHVWLIDLELRRTKSFRKRHRKRLVEVEDRHVFYGNGYRLVEVWPADLGRNFAYKTRNRRYRRNFPPAVAQRNAFDLVNEMKDDIYGFGWSNPLVAVINGRIVFNRLYKFPSVSVLAYEKMP